MVQVGRMSCEQKSPLPGEHPEYSLGFAFSLLLFEILFVPEVGLHLFEVHSANGSEGVFGNRRGRVCRGLLRGRGSNFGDILRAVGLVAATMELVLGALVLWLLAILDAMAFCSAVETLVVSWQRVSFTLAFLLLVPRESADVFFGSWSKSNLH